MGVRKQKRPQGISVLRQDKMRQDKIKRSLLKSELNGKNQTRLKMIPKENLQTKASILKKLKKLALVNDVRRQRQHRWRCSTTTTTTTTFYGHNYPILFKKQIESIEATVKRRRTMNFTASRMLTDTLSGSVFLIIAVRHWGPPY